MTDFSNSLARSTDIFFKNAAKILNAQKTNLLTYGKVYQ